MMQGKKVEEVAGLAAVTLPQRKREYVGGGGDEGTNAPRPRILRRITCPRPREFQETLRRAAGSRLQMPNAQQYWYPWATACCASGMTTCCRKPTAYCESSGRRFGNIRLVLPHPPPLSIFVENGEGGAKGAG